MDKFSELIKRRRSMRKFTPELPDEDSLRLLLRAALMAPSGHGLASRRFVVVTDTEKLVALSRSKEGGSAFLAETPMAIVVLGDPQVSDVWVEDASIASAFIQLQAEDLGLGSCWVQIRGRKDAEGVCAEERVREILDIPAHLRVLSIVAVGHKGMERKPFNEERLLWDKVSYCKGEN